MTWTVWKRGDPDTRKKAVWDEHVETGLDEILRDLIDIFGPPVAVAIREKQPIERCES